MSSNNNNSRGAAYGIRLSRISPLTALLLILLSESPLSTWELSNAACIEPRQVWSQLKHWMRRGIVARSGDAWRLTDKGMEIVRLYRPLLEAKASSLLLCKGTVTEPLHNKRSREERGASAAESGLGPPEWAHSIPAGLDSAHQSGASPERASGVPAGVVPVRVWECVAGVAEALLGRRLRGPEARVLLLLLVAGYYGVHYVRLDAASLLERFGSVGEYEEALRALMDAGVVWCHSRSGKCRLDRALASRCLGTTGDSGRTTSGR